jgi:hypothetical protein
MKTKRTVVLGEEQIEALKQVIDYLADEAIHYGETCESEMDTGNHIWLSVRILMECIED